MSILPEARAEFWRRYMLGEPGTCWRASRFSRASKGYAQYSFFIDGKQHTFSAHRIAYEIFNGPIPEGMVVRHSCTAAPDCLNPDHLHLGTPRDNVLDTFAAGRRTPAPGSTILDTQEYARIPLTGGVQINTALTSANVEDIKRFRAQGQHVADVARMMCVSPEYIRAIDAGRIHGDIPGPPPSRTGPLARRKLITRGERARAAAQAPPRMRTA